MKIRSIQEALNASVITGSEYLEAEVDQVYASDLMSDVLAFGKSNSILFTGLATQQAIISAHMAEFKGVVLIRGKRPIDGAEKVANDNNLILLTTKYDMFDACVRVNSCTAGGSHPAVEAPASGKTEDLILNNDFIIEGDDFSNAGMVSTEVKAILKKIGLDSKLIRRVAISTYEAEMNVVMHAKDARVNLMITPSAIEVTIADRGKGIPDVEQAMQEGWSTATEDMRAMGFGAGMGLPNIRRNCDELEVSSKVNIGTTLKMKFAI